MPRLLFLFAFILTSSFIFAQDAAEGAPQEATLDKAFEASELAIKDKTAKKKADTWLQRAALHMDLATTDNAAFKALCAKPYQEILNCYKKAKVLDAKKDISKEVTKAETAMFDAAEQAYKTKDYPIALELYEHCFLTSSIIEQPNKKAAYNLAKTAEKVKNYEKAVIYYQKAIDLDYRSEMAYLSKSYAYYKKKDFENATLTLQTAFEKYPENENVVSGYISNLFQDKRYNIIDTLVVHHPENSTLITSIGSYYAKKTDTYDKAMGLLVYALELDDANFNANNDLGRIYTEKAATLKEAAATNSEAVMEFYQKAMPLLEKALTIKKYSASTKRLLKETYIQLDMKDKAEALK